MKKEPEVLTNIDIDFFKDIQNNGNELFIMFGENQNEMSEIIEINEFPSYHGIHRTPFSVTIATHTDVIYPQKIYQVINHKNQRADVFLVPVAKKENFIHYQAVFS